jgi:hypothetical protein
VDNEVQRLIESEGKGTQASISYVDKVVSEDDESHLSRIPPHGIELPNTIIIMGHLFFSYVHKGAFTPNFKLVLSENLGGILGGTQC